MSKDEIFIGSLSGIALTIIIGIFLDYYSIDISEAIELLAATSTALVFIIALATYGRTVSWRIKDQADVQSKFNMDMAIQGYERVYDLLSDQNNQRVRWLMASRALGEAQKLESFVKNENHKVALNLKKMEIRNSLYEILSVTNPDTGEHESLPPSFFYGATDWANTSIEEAARESTSPMKTYPRLNYENAPGCKLKRLDPSSIILIFSFLDYPDGYKDPLDEVDVDIEYSTPFGLKQGPENYIHHLKDHAVMSGMCYRYGDEEQREAEWQRVYNEPAPRT